MIEKATGGPAFPSDVSGGHPRGPGMTLRDYAAIKFAVAALVTANGLGSVTAAERESIFGQLAAISYELADAMLKERDQC